MRFRPGIDTKQCVLVYIDDEIKDGCGEPKAHEVQEFVIQGQRMRKVGEAKEGQKHHDNACEQKKPLGSNRYTFRRWSQMNGTDGSQTERNIIFWYSESM